MFEFIIVYILVVDFFEFKLLCCLVNLHKFHPSHFVIQIFLPMVFLLFVGFQKEKKKFNYVRSHLLISLLRMLYFSSEQKKKKVEKDIADGKRSYAVHFLAILFIDLFYLRIFVSLR